MQPTHLDETKASTWKADLRMSHVGDKVVKMLVANTTLVTSLTSLKDKIHGKTKKEVKAIAKSALEAVQVGLSRCTRLTRSGRHKV